MIFLKIPIMPPFEFCTRLTQNAKLKTKQQSLI